MFFFCFAFQIHCLIPFFARVLKSSFSERLKNYYEHGTRSIGGVMEMQDVTMENK